MRHILISLLLGIITFSLFITDVEAKRFGGGKSFGMSRQTSHFSRNTSTPSAAPNAAKPAATGNKWIGPLAGLAAGGLLASLFMGHGLGTGILSWLLIAVAALFIWRFIRSRLSAIQPMQRATLQPHGLTTPTTPILTPLHATPTVIPNNFDETAFLRGAKTAFIRLQAAYDTKNLADIREFTTPEVFAEIQMQLQEHGDEINQTEVINIHATLLDLVTESNKMIASTLFEGMIKETPTSEPIAIKEIWHFCKIENTSNPNWTLAGIQQENE